MIRTLAITNDQRLEVDLPLAQLAHADIDWYWVDFNVPNKEEALLLENHFHFHHLAVEDCLQFLQRPKLDYYDGYHFLVLHAINKLSLASEEVDMFVGRNYVITFHHNQQEEIDEAWQRMCSDDKLYSGGPNQCAHLIIDKLVDYFFPIVQKMEDELMLLDNDLVTKSIDQLMNEVYEIRSQLLLLRRSINPMRDLLYRIINSDRLTGGQEQLVYFTDIYDHLLKLSDMIESNREITADMRDSYMSINANRMNATMRTLTVITTIFMPLTFIAGIYGMNFTYMPELEWSFGYFLVLGIMGIVGILMVIWFRRKGLMN